MAKINFTGTFVKPTSINDYVGLNMKNIDTTGLAGVDTSKYYVYHHYKLDTNELFYIGKGIGERAISAENRNLHWHHIVDKHKCKVVIIAENLTSDEALQLEIEEIGKYGRIDKNTGILVNMTDGGDGGRGLVYTEEMREYRRELMTGEGNHQFGIKRFGNENPNFGNKYGDNPLAKAVICLTLSGEFVKKYNSLSETELDGFNATIVSKCCSGQRQHNKNHRFMYESDYLSNKPVKEYKRGKTSVRKVVGINKTNNTYKIYNRAKDTAIDGFNPKVVQQCCTKLKKSHGGVFWYYLEEVENELLRYSLISNEN